MGKLDDLAKELAPVKSPMHIVLLILNIIWSGLGTMINSCMGSKFNSTCFLVGLIQWLTAFCLVGWIWSIYWGILIFQKNK